MFSKFHSRKGFTLIELMIVVVIIGILAALAIPRFMQATTKSKQSEAKGILKQIYTMERTYRQDPANGNTYLACAAPGDFATLGVELQPQPPRLYTYVVVADATTFTATATANLDDDGTIDTWQIDQTGFLQNTTNDATS